MEPPIVHVENRQRVVRFDVKWLRRFASVAVGKSLLHSGDGRFALDKLREVEVAIVSDHVIAAVHGRFMNIAGATDVITFQHGEIVISAQTAQASAQRLGRSLEEELALYIVHGLLHLNGWNDQSPSDRTAMHRVQKRILRACLVEVAPA